MKLCLRLGCTLRELQGRMSLSEFRQWIAFNRISPIGDERWDVMHAITAQAAISPHLKRGKSMTVNDLIPNWSQEQKRESVQASIVQRLMGLVKQTGGTSNG